MKNIYFFASFLMVMFSASLFAQSRVYAPELSSPENYGTRQMPDAILDWHAVTGGGLEIEYEAQLALTADFSNAITFDKTTLTSITMSELLFGQQYFWRVRAYDGSEVSDWSEVWNFTVLNSFRFESNPGDGDEVYTNQTVRWESIIGLSQYQVQIDTLVNWNKTTSGTTDNIFDVAVLAADDKWAVGEGGLIMHYDGTEWMTVDAGVSGDLFDVWFVDATNAFAVGESGLILYYDGSSWVEQTSGVSEDLFGASFVDANTGWVVGDEGTILAYSAGTWSVQESPESVMIMDVFANNASNVWACGEDSFVFFFDGSEWVAEEIGIRDYNGIWFNNENDGWIVGTKGSIFHYDGQLWNPMDPGTKDELFSVHFDGSVGYASGDKGTVCMYNGDWSRTTSSYFDEEMYSIYVMGTDVIAVGEGGAMSEITQAGFDSPFLRTYDVNTSNGVLEFDSIYFTNLLFGKSFYYRLKGMHSQDTTAWSGVKSFMTYPAPELKKPNDGTTDTHLAVELKWDEYDGATQYNIEVSKNEDFNPQLTYVSDSNSILAKVSDFDQLYYWRVRAAHPEDISMWSEVFTFTTINKVTLVAPENEDQSVNKCPRFEWEAIEGVPTYEVWLSLDANFTNPEMATTEEDFLQCQSSLDYDTEYFWKVRGVTAVENSDWSEEYSFRTEAQIGVDEYFTSQSVSVYPNPAQTNAYVSIDSPVDETYTLIVSDVSGKVISEAQMVCFKGMNEMQLNIETLNKGIYVISIKKDNAVVTKKLFVE